MEPRFPCRLGFLTLLQKLQALFADDPMRVATESEELARSLEPTPAVPGAGPSDDDLRAAADAAFRYLRGSFDREYGGFTVWK